VHKGTDMALHGLESELVAKVGLHWLHVVAGTSMWLPRAAPHGRGNASACATRVLLVSVSAGSPSAPADGEALTGPCGIPPSPPRSWSR
jgi:hypothetical protein